MNQTLRIATWNANGLVQKAMDLELFLTNDRIDICLVSETHFTNQSHLKIRGFCIYHVDHPSNKARGGSAVVIKNSIKHYENTEIKLETMQVTTVTVNIRNKNFNISSIYCPPRYNLKREDYAKLFKTIGHHFIIGGDFNAKNTYWGSRLTTAKGKALYESGMEISCDFYSTGNPTYWPSDIRKTPDLIDFFIAKGLSDRYAYVCESYGLASDHSPVILTISGSIIQKDEAPKLTNFKTNWDDFRHELSNHIELWIPLKTPEQVEEEVESYVHCIQQSAWNNTPCQSKYKSNIIYPIEVRELIQKKRKIRKKWQITRVPQYKSELNQLSNKLKNLLKQIKSESISKYLEGLAADKENDFKIWKATKSFKRPKVHIPPIRKVDNTWARSNKEKADMFAAHLEDIFVPFEAESGGEKLISIEKNDSIDIRKVTYNELVQEIRSLNIKKAPGYELITGKILKELPEKALLKLLHLINASFRLRYVPRQWKFAEVIMIPKPGKDPREKTSYRPISLLPTISKVFEKLLIKRLKPLIKERALIPQHQFGFRDNHSTIDQVHRITNVIEKALEERKVCSSLFLDVSQAFDKVWHEGLLYKLQRDLPKQFYQILKSYLTERCFRIKYDGEFSQVKNIAAGVPQGSVLGPLLYQLYTRDIPRDPDTVIATFADDTAIMAVGTSAEETKHKIQKAIDKVCIWIKKWRTKLNESKSSFIHFTNRNINPTQIIINGHSIAPENTAKYLGMTLDAKIHWKEHVKKKIIELNIKFRKMNWLIGRRSTLDLHNKLLVYKQVIKPIWTYGIQLWGCTKKTNVKMMQTFQNKALRSMANAPWFVRNDDLHRDLRISTVTEEIQRYAIMHRNRLTRHENPEMLGLLDNAEDMRRLKRTRPLDICGC